MAGLAASEPRQELLGGGFFDVVLDPDAPVGLAVI
jgi:hypothetical protein